ncbi:Polyglutamate biosynthesis protein, variant 3 [Balamuthia mandrillaris]
MFAGGSSSSSSSAVSSAIKQSMDKKSLFRVLAVGDVMLGRLVDGLFPTHNDDPEHAGHAKRYLKAVSGGPERLAQYKKQQYKFVWGDTLPLFQEADVRVINLETSVTTHDVKNPKTFNYRMHPANLRALHEAHVDYCSLANNHTLDYCEEGLFDTIKHMNKSGIKWAGAGRNLSEARAPAIISCQDRKIAFFRYPSSFFLCLLFFLLVFLFLPSILVLLSLLIFFILLPLSFLLLSSTQIVFRTTPRIGQLQRINQVSTTWTSITTPRKTST